MDNEQPAPRAEATREQLIHQIRVLRMRIKRLEERYVGPTASFSAKVAELRTTLADQRAMVIHQRVAMADHRATIATQRTALIAQRASLTTQRDEARRLRQLLAQSRAERKRLRRANRVAASADASGSSSLAAMIQQGMPLLSAALAYTRRLLRDKDWQSARAFAQRLRDDAETHRIGTLCTAVHVANEGSYGLAHQLFSTLDAELVIEHAFVEYMETLFNQDIAEALRVGEERLNANLQLPIASWWPIARVAIAQRQYAFVRRVGEGLAGQLDDLPNDDREAATVAFATVARRLQAELAIPDAEASTPRIAVLDYKLPDLQKSSSNIGDPIQTLAFLSNLARFTAADFTAGDEALGRWVDGLKATLPQSARIESEAWRVALEVVDRDFSSAAQLTEPTWLFAYGWYMHASFKGTPEFPFQKAVRPIFVSFHLDDPAMLNAEAIAYLRRCGPVGCRDWSTVYSLRDVNVAAFFSGCMTSTLGKLFGPPPASQKSSERHVALVDYRAEGDEFDSCDVTRFGHASPLVRQASLTGNLDAALMLLEAYRGYDRIVTSRLHCYLPCRALGLDVDFRPRTLADLRFEGLIDVTDIGFQRMREGLEHKIATVLDKILGGAGEEDVYATWRRLCAADCEAADQYCRDYPPLPKSSLNVLQAAAALKTERYESESNLAATSDVATTIELAFALDQNLADELPVVIESALAHTRAPMRVHLLLRGLPPAYGKRLESDFGERVQFVCYNCDAIAYGAKLRLLPHTTVSTIDRLLLPELLAPLDRVIYLDVDLLVRGDLAELWAVDLGASPLAAHTSIARRWQYGHELVRRASLRLPHTEAWAMRRRLHAEGSLAFRAFNAGVLLLNLQRMRDDDFSRRHVALVEHCSMNDQDVLNVYARGQRVELGVEWNAVPTQDPIDDARIVHFAGPVKPWSDPYIAGRDEFESHRRAYLQRAGASAVNGATTGSTRHQQKSTHTTPDRHVDLLQALARSHALAERSAPRVLSFGCSQGYELEDLHRVFPSAVVCGCDIDAQALAAARERCAAFAAVFESTPAAIAANGPFDLIVAFNVLCRYPDSAGLDNITGVYPFAAFEEGVALLDSALAEGGVLGVYNSPYFFEHAGIAARYALAGAATRRNGWIEKCSPSGERLTDVCFSHAGERHARAEWSRLQQARAARGEPPLTEQQVEYTHSRLAGESGLGSFETVFWCKQRLSR